MVLSSPLWVRVARLLVKSPVEPEFWTAVPISLRSPLWSTVIALPARVPVAEPLWFWRTPETPLNAVVPSPRLLFAPDWVTSRSLRAPFWRRFCDAEPATLLLPPLWSIRAALPVPAWSR